MKLFPLKANSYNAGEIYLQDSDYFESPKYMFDFILSSLRPFIDNHDAVDWLDVGCARGEFLYWLSKRLKGSFTGVDLLSELVESGRSYFLNKSVNIELQSSSADLYRFSRSFDVVTMLGLLPCFEDIRGVICHRHEVL